MRSNDDKTSSFFLAFISLWLFFLLMRSTRCHRSEGSKMDGVIWGQDKNVPVAHRTGGESFQERHTKHEREREMMARDMSKENGFRRLQRGPNSEEDLCLRTHESLAVRTCTPCTTCCSPIRFVRTTHVAGFSFLTNPLTKIDLHTRTYVHSGVTAQKHLNDLVSAGGVDLIPLSPLFLHPLNRPYTRSTDIA